MNVDCGCKILFLGIFVSDFQYLLLAVWSRGEMLSYIVLLGMT
jgi:hypothetical protein